MKKNSDIIKRKLDKEIREESGTWIRGNITDRQMEEWSKGKMKYFEENFWKFKKSEIKGIKKEL
jgi:hypothetical protein